MYISIGKNLKLESTNDTRISKLVRDYVDIHDNIESKYPDTDQPIVLKDILESLVQSFTIEWEDLPSGATFVWTSNGEPLTNPVRLPFGTDVDYELTYSDGSKCIGTFIVSGDYTLDLSTLEPNEYLVTITSDKTLSKATITRHYDTPQQETIVVTTFDNNSYSFYGNKDEVVKIIPLSDDYTYQEHTLSDNGHTYIYTVTENTTCSALFPYEAWKSLSIKLKYDDGTIISNISSYWDNITFTGDSSKYDYKREMFSDSFVVWCEKNFQISWEINISGYSTINDSTTVTNDKVVENTLVQMCVYTLTPNPSTATVTLAAAGYTTVSGVGPQSITVAKNTTVIFYIECEGYNPVQQVRIIDRTPYDETFPLTPSGHYKINIDDYEYTLDDTVITLTKYIGNSIDVDTPELEEI